MRSSKHKLKLLRTITAVDVSTVGAINSSHHQYHLHQTQQQQNSFARHHYSSARSPQKSSNGSHNPTNSHKNSSVPCGNNNLNNNNSKSSFHTVPSIVTSDNNNINVFDSPFEGGENLLNMEAGLSSDIRIKAFGICRDYLHGAWKQIDLRDLILKRVNGGLSNWLYHCSLPLNLAPVNDEPTQVLLRFYGQVHGEDALESLITESVIFTLLSERKLGPKLFGVFPGGRIEQFIPARALLTKELRDPEISRLITQKMAQIHGLKIPISKEPTWLWGTMERWMSNIRENLSKGNQIQSHQKEIIQTFVDNNLEKELHWLKKFLLRVGSPVVFSHNDLQEGNILIRPDHPLMEEKLVLIDFEYCSYNYRGFDLANHFCEWSFNYNINTYPNFIHEPADFPTIEEQRIFIRSYLNVLRLEYKRNHCEVDEDFLQNSILFNEDHVLKEVEAFTLCSHFFWCLWSVVNAQISKIPFGYWEYAISRLETYFALKKKHLH